MTTEVTQIVRLQPHVYEQLEKECLKPLVTEATTPIQAGYLLGIQYVLKKLREGFVIKE